MKKEETTKRVFRGRDAVMITLIWAGVYLLTVYLLERTITSLNIIFMFLGITLILIFNILLKNGW